MKNKRKISLISYLLNQLLPEVFLYVLYTYTYSFIKEYSLDNLSLYYKVYRLSHRF